ncbi:MAG TPA: LptA/OstA family protein [Acidobacteriaceae bacterium]|nr:LptA/OstA family protein [Acidobacteriaceae bacterium]
MRVTVVRLRQAILIVAGLLVAVLIGFFAYARYRLHHLERDLPARLGINIQQTASGYTYSQSSGGHTLFTIHASRLIQYKSGSNATLHDVSITLYGPPGSDRVDKISGSDFDYDPKDQIVQAHGTVSIDLQGFGNGEAAQQGRIHVTTSGLVFNQKTGQADTSQHTDFAFPKASGSCTGAHYNSKTGILVLDSQVALTTTTQGSPAVIHAAHAQIVRDSDQAYLLDPQTEYKSERASADSAIVQFRPDGSAESIHAMGHVRVVRPDGAVLTATDSVTQLDDASHLETVDLTGGVNYSSTSQGQSMQGTAGSGTLTFGGNSLLRHAQFRDAVRFVDQVFKLAHQSNGAATREMEADKVDIDFAPGPHGKSAVAKKALAVGSAVVNLRTIPSRGPQQLTTISGDQLLATLASDGRAIRRLDGTGHTRIVDLARDGSTNTSTGDTLHVTFNVPPPAPRGSKPNRNPSATGTTSQVETAIQDGHVILVQKPAPKPGAAAPAPLTAWASHAEYHAATQVLRLTGNPRLDDGGSMQLTAGVIDFHRDTGDAGVSGDVKAIWIHSNNSNQPTPKRGASAPAALSLGGEGPVHITADHAFLRRANGSSTFYGNASTDARMWQGVNSIMAPVLELTRSPQTLKAFGAPGSAGPVVDANFTSSTGAKHTVSAVRVRSHTLFYSDKDRRGDFVGEVTAQDPDGTIHADEAEVYLTPAGKTVKGHGQNSQAQLDRIVATGHIVITQPGRKGVGERLVYTADDGRYVLTGTPGHPPYLEDETKGTTTGATLIFNSQNDSVLVSGGRSSAVTETRAPK